ncbi:MAG: WYL domain-containing protein [Pirellulales bacterium]
MSEQNSLVRQWILLRTLSSRRDGVTVKEIALELGVCDKTVRRDLVAFAAAGFPLNETVEAHGRKFWRLSLGNGQPELSFAFDEALALFLGRRFLEPLAGTYLWEAAQQAFKKVRACLGRPALAYLEKMAGNLHHTTIGASDYSTKAEVVDDLMRAIEDRRQTIITYRSLKATEPVEYAIDPLGIVYHRGSLYLVAFSHDHEELRHFKVDRLDEIEVGKLPFQMPDDFNLQEHLRGSFGIFHGTGDVAVKVRFFPPVARYVLEGRWHASQKLQSQRDGSVLAEFRLSATEEIKRWLLSFGGNAEVLEPDELRADLLSEAEQLLSAYIARPGNKTLKS